MSVVDFVSAVSILLTLALKGEPKITVFPSSLILPYSGVVQVRCYLALHLPTPCQLTIYRHNVTLFVGVNVRSCVLDMGDVSSAMAGLYCCNIQYPRDKNTQSCIRDKTGQFFNIKSIASCNSLSISTEHEDFKNRTGVSPGPA